MRESSRRYIVFGTGAVGGAAAVLLDRAGCEVVAVARGAHRDAIAAAGLTLRTPDGDTTARVAVTSSDELRVDRERDVVLLAVKSHDTPAALSELVAAGGDGATIVCAQNGVANERMCARVTDRVWPAMVWTPAVFLSPGVIVCYAQPHPALWVLGTWPRGGATNVAGVVADLQRAGIAALAVDDVMRIKYGKLLDNLGNAVDALFDIGDELDDSWRAVLHGLRAEGEAALRAANIAWAPHAEIEALVSGRVGIASIDGARRPGGSTWQSLARKHGSLEVDYLNGEICLLGGLHGVPTPLNRGMLHVAAEHVRARRAPRTATLDALRRAVAPNALP